MAAGDPGSLKRNFSATAIETTLVNSISSAATGDTTTSVSVVSVSGFPSVPYTLILGPDTNKEEVVTVTAAAGTTLTILRGQDNTQAQAHSAGTSVRHGVSGRDFKEEQTHIAARGYDADSGILSNAGITHVHGLQTGDGSVVGSTQTVTLTNKTISGGTFTGSITATNAELQNVTLAGTPVITGLSSVGMSASSAAPKSYVDSILGSATAASTSAASAATSATSAATSATSAAASATASASSASAAATSASSALTSQTAAATSATSAAASATAAATSATSAAASATTASNSAATATTQAANAATSATSAATSATNAAASAAAAATSATSAAASATASASSASAAATSASSAATSAASALTSQTAAATSATSAATSATAAATSATSAAASATASASSASAAATSASSAATSASSAATSATAAATSAASAATSATSSATSAALAASIVAGAIQGTLFDAKGDLLVGTANDAVSRLGVGTDGYLLTADSTQTTGIKWASAPVSLPSQTGNTGKYLQTDGSTASWVATAVPVAQPTEPTSPTDGQIWIDTDGTAPTTVVTRWTKQPAAGTTSLTGNDDYSIPLAYSAGYEQVFLNGVLLSRTAGEYTATSGTAITLASATVAGDIVEVICPLQIATTDTYTQSAVNAAFLPNTNNFTAGKNKIINGDFSIAQRGTTITMGQNGYSLDRWRADVATAFPTGNITQQTFTPGNTISGYEFSNYARINPTAANGCTVWQYSTYLEDVRIFAGQTATLSFWAKADASCTATIDMFQNFGSGGSTTVSVLSATNVSLTTSWTRFTFTVSVPSILSKTIGTSSFFGVRFSLPTSAGVIRTGTYELAGFQLEAGSNATAFQTATGTIQGELAACQRYFEVLANGADATNEMLGTLQVYSTTQAFGALNFKTTKRGSTTLTISSNTDFRVRNTSAGTVATTTMAAGTITPRQTVVTATVASGLTAGSATTLELNSATGYIWAASEL